MSASMDLLVRQAGLRRYSFHDKRFHVAVGDYGDGRSLKEWLGSDAARWCECNTRGFWSMSLVPGRRDGQRLVRFDFTLAEDAHEFTAWRKRCLQANRSVVGVTIMPKGRILPIAARSAGPRP